MNFSSAYPYVALVQNVSQCWALYCLVLFYHATSHRLSDLRPLAKFLGIKIIVFFTWWQDLIIASLVHFDVISGFENSRGLSTKEEAAALLANFMITIEMLVMAEAFVFAFPPSDYAAPPKKQRVGRGKYLMHSAVDSSSLLVGSTPLRILTAHDPEVSPWDEASHRDGLSAEHVVKDLVGVMSFYDVLNDIVVMNSLGRDRGGSASFLERIFGRRRFPAFESPVPGQPEAQTPLGQKPPQGDGDYEPINREGEYAIFGPDRRVGSGAITVEVI
jgi:hypothetical protein